MTSYVNPLTPIKKATFLFFFLKSAKFIFQFITDFKGRVKVMLSTTWVKR